MSGPPHRLLSREFLTLAVAAAVYNASFGAVNALLPRYVVDVIGGTETMAGVVMGSMAFTALLSRPWFGRLADRAGARRIIVQGALTSALGLVLLLVGDSLALAIAARMVMGLGNAGVFTGSTLLGVNLAPIERRAEAASYVLVSVHLGFGLGPVLGEAIRNSMSYDAAWIMAASMAALASLCAMALTHRPGEPHARPGPLVNRHAIGPGVVTLFGVFAFNGLLTFAPLYGREIGLRDVGLVFTTASLTIVVMRVLFGRVPDRIGPVRAGSWALVVTAAAAALVALWDEPAGLYIGAAALAVGLSLQSPSFMSLAVADVDDRERGSAMATYTGFFDVANAFVGPSVGLIVSGVGYQPAFLFTASMSLVGLVVLRVVVAPGVTRGATGPVPITRLR